jgi:hypothetical protein
LKTFPLRHAILAQRDTFLQAAANFLQDPQIPRVSPFDFPCRPAASFRPLCCFFRPLTGFTMAPSSMDWPLSLLGRPFSRIGMPSENELRPLC